MPRQRTGPLALVVITAAMSLTACGAASPGSPSAAPRVAGSPAAAAKPTAVATGMHVVQVVGTADPVLSQVEAALEGGGSLPSPSRLHAVSEALQSFAGVAPVLPAVTSDDGSVAALGAASASVGRALTPLAGPGSLSAQAKGSLLASIAAFRAAASRAGLAVGASPAG